MESPNKRVKLSPSENDYVSLATDDAEATKFGYLAPEAEATQLGNPKTSSPITHQKHDRRVLQDRRHAQDRPKSKISIPGHDPWLLVWTKYGRKFVHNARTKASFWRIPSDLVQAIEDLEVYEHDQAEKKANAKWAEEQLEQMRKKSVAEEVNRAADEEGRHHRRRSESLQREDEAALMAELNAEVAAGEEHDVRETLEAIEHKDPQPGDHGYDSDGESYEYVEVTDSEGEEDVDHDDHGESKERNDMVEVDHDEQQEVGQEHESHLEFGEDDIAFQLAAMGEDYGLDPGEYGEDPEGQWEEGAEGLPLSEEDAISLFRDLLDDAGVSPYTPWDKIVSDESPASILNDDRYTVLPNMKARKEAWDAWVKDTAARVRSERALMEKKDPRIAYLAFLSEKATPKLYWPEFKRKFKREAEMNERRLSEKEREKLYRDHITRLKLSETTRKADLLALLKSVPAKNLNRSNTPASLPEQVLANLHYISLPPMLRDSIIATHIRALPPAPEGDDDISDQQRAELEKKRADRQKREAALAARERAVAEEKRKAEKEERFARRDLLEEERELQRAMRVNRDGLRANLAEAE